MCMTAQIRVCKLDHFPLGHLPLGHFPIRSFSIQDIFQLGHLHLELLPVGWKFQEIGFRSFSIRSFSKNFRTFSISMFSIRLFSNQIIIHQVIFRLDHFPIRALSIRSISNQVIIHYIIFFRSFSIRSIYAPPIIQNSLISIGQSYDQEPRLIRMGSPV